MATDPTKSSQCARILAYLKDGNSLTPTEALRMFGCFRLGARVFDLKEQGYPILSERITVPTADGGSARVARYWMDGVSAPGVVR